MAYTTGTITNRSRIYNMTGITNYTASSGTDLGRVSDLVMAKFERDLTLYRGLRTGTTPTDASIDGEGVVLEFALWEYDAATMATLFQRIIPSGKTNNFHGFGNQSYKLGRKLGTNELLSLMIADEEAPNDYPKLYIHRAVIVDVEGLVMSRGSQGSMTSPATIRVIGLHSDTLGSPMVFGDSSAFPSLA